jgi:protein gp37
MGAKTKIEWTDASWTPIRARHKETGKVGWHCEHVTPGCEHCYAEGMNKRLGTGLPFKPGHRKNIEIFLNEEMLMAPLRFKQPLMIFVCSMTDLFADFVTDEWIDQVFAVMALCPQHTFQVLTKRSARMREYLIARDGMGNAQLCSAINTIPELLGNRHGALEMPLPNVWLGVSCEDQQRADERIPDLLATPAAVRFVSAEPLLGSMDLRTYLRPHTRPNADGYGGNEGPGWTARFTKLDWIIVGGESGREARPMHPDWARSIRDQCAAAGTAYFFKQHGEWLPIHREDETGWQADDGGAPGRFDGKRAQFTTLDGQEFAKVGKTRAGRLLDSVEHNTMPEVRR